MTFKARKLKYLYSITFQGPVVQKVANAIQWINPYPLDNSIGFAGVYPVDSAIHLLNNPGQVFHNPYEPCLRGGQILDIPTGIAEVLVRIPVQQT